MSQTGDVLKRNPTAPLTAAVLALWVGLVLGALLVLPFILLSMATVDDWLFLAASCGIWWSLLTVSAGARRLWLRSARMDSRG